MRVIFGLTLLLFSAFNVSAQNQTLTPAIMSELAVKSMLLGIDNAGEEAVVAVGERGHIVRSTDGVNFTQVKSPTQTTLTAVTFYNELLGWAVGHNATILHTADGGVSWKVQQHQPKNQYPILDINFKSATEGVAVGAYGMYFRTEDGGNTWQREYHVSLLPQEDVEYLEELRKEDEEAYLEERNSILPHFNRIYVDGRTSYLAGELGLIAKSNDFGRTWERFEDFYHGSFYDVKRSIEGNIVAVGLRGNVFRSEDNGIAWANVQSDTTALLNQLVVSQSGQLFALGNNGVLLESNDDGVSFSKSVQDDGKGLLSGVVFNNSLVIASEVGIKVLKVVK